MVGRRWTQDELLLVLHLYWRIPFGRQHKGNPEVKVLAARIERTPGSVAMKLNNFTSLDPEERARGVKGLEGASELDEQVWHRFVTHREEAAARAEELWRTIVEGESPAQIEAEVAPEAPLVIPTGPTADVRLRTVRLGQQFFRRTVLDNFGGRCALTGISHRALLTASHIVPWSEGAEGRLDPKNGLALNRLHDAAFDRWLITFDEDHRLVVSRALREAMPEELLSSSFLAYEGKPLRAPERWPVGREFLAQHQAAFGRLNG